MRIFCCLLLLLSTFALAQPIPTDCRQVVLVVSQDWDATTGQLTVFNKTEQGWQADGQPWQISLGRTGLAWGLGLHPQQSAGPNKREGDGKSPAGVFSLTHVFGYRDPHNVDGLPFLLVDDRECIDDPESDHYNQIVSARQVARDWKSSEIMKIDIYRLGLVVAHNVEHRPGAGSCIFMHRWSKPRGTTAGCTAMPADRLSWLCRWLRHDAHPVLVQLPADSYRTLREEWKLP